ncbi:hypothetical protein [Schleiferia thermophila]|jgi:hypothetical protein|uniref:Uncharacterized protein n=1 Tax=Schleiferia thermophila TaxID=884107 RepID=A0A368ZYB7_9FLAO|nr:hypothetical protein [Schleiferia thermophila]KFD38818.1 hypothetical protein AT05_08305 [Schleiferia thermophila str. Yellowstone]PMB20973.1 hypothetical protein CEN47_21385 [Fischerella thermalis CCMEE 5319]RCX01925.1 hypothetical protein DES35_10624 [Schleiferia thermophila]GCD79768.1 hypothetical protein JCM30197_10150 [Schleiferia thermophila]
MDREILKEKWERLVGLLSQRFSQGEDLDLDGILFLIGVQELGKGYKRFKKDEKINLMHIAICRLLQPYGYYEFEGIDSDGWPHYRLVQELPRLKPGEQSWLMKEAVIQYFEELDLI